MKYIYIIIINYSLLIIILKIIFNKYMKCDTKFDCVRFD